MDGRSFIHSFVLSFIQDKHTVFFSGLLQPDGAGPEPVDLEDDQDFEEYGTFENDDQPREEEGKEDAL